MLRAIDISTSGLVAQRQRMNVIAGNIANAYTTRDADGNLSPFRRRFVTFSAENAERPTQGNAVRYEVNIDTTSAPRQVYNPSHPDADENGIVRFPNIDMVREFVNALDASRAYEANVAVIDMTRELASLSLRILA